MAGSVPPPEDAGASAFAPLAVHERGTAGPWVIVLHGGPAAAGNAAPIARALAGRFRTLEPWQRGSGAAPLTVARHVADLLDVIDSRCAGTRPALVGESWGAMLALAFAAQHPHRAGPLVLIGCGTFDPKARARMGEILESRMGEDLRARLERLDRDVADPHERLARRYDLVRPLYDFARLEADLSKRQPIQTGKTDGADREEAPPCSVDAPPQCARAPSCPEPRPGPFDVRAHNETWADMLSLQTREVYPAAFASIRSPVLMLHGDYDPHPGAMVRDSLTPLIPHIEYIELERCGHSPWNERHASREFFALLTDWLERRLGGRKEDDRRG